MDNQPDNLTDLERRLAALTPAKDGLDADRMLFAAGRASVAAPGRRLFWPALAGFLALLSGGFGAAFFNEQARYASLSREFDQVRQPVTPATNRAPVPASSPTPETMAIARPAADSVLASHRVLESGLDAVSFAPADTSSRKSAPSDTPVLRPWPTTNWPGL